MERSTDILVVGAGAIGASVAYHLTQLGHAVTVVEKEEGPARHQSGRNSGVIHAGYNLKPGSQKARFCVEGSRRLRVWCREHAIRMQELGILVVAVAEEERATLAELEKRASANGVRHRRVGRDAIRALEPEVAGIDGLHAPDGASFDAVGYVESLVVEASRSGARFLYGTKVASPPTETARGVRVATNRGDFEAKALVNCGGLHADRLAGEIGQDLRIVPFRGYYAELVPGRAQLVRGHVYRAPHLSMPFLGVHLSRRFDGRVIVGPGAMLAFGREAYRLDRADLRDLHSMLTWPGFYRMLCRPEIRALIRSEVGKSISLARIHAEAHELVPGLRRRDIVRSFAGNRAQVVDSSGNLVDDIVVRQSARSVHVLNAVSPGLTCSLPFGEHLATLALDVLNR